MGYNHGFALHRRDVRRCKADEQFRGSRVGGWEPGLMRSSFDVIPSFITRRRDRG